jgi:hypothetical protein
MGLCEELLKMDKADNLLPKDGVAPPDSRSMAGLLLERIRHCAMPEGLSELSWRPFAFTYWRGYVTEFSLLR